MNDVKEPLGGEAERPQSLRAPILPSQAEQDSHSSTPTIPVMVPGVSAGEGPRRPTSPATTAGGESQHHAAGLHIHARPTSTTSTIRKTSHLHHPHSHRVYDGTLHSGAYLKYGLHSTSSSTTTSLHSEAWLYEEYLQESHLLTHIRVKGRWKGSTGTSLTNFAQQRYNGAKTSKLNLVCCLQSHLLGHFNTSSSSSTTASYALQTKRPT